MRVISGKAKGLRLETPPNDAVRPTTDKVKEAVFSIIQFYIEDSNCLDLFSGTGQIGIELLSRGANSVAFVDKDSKSLKITKNNLMATKLDEKAKVFHSDAVSFLQKSNEIFDIIYMDPPFSTEILENSLKISEKNLSENGIIVCEYPKNFDINKNFDKLTLDREYCYGKISICIFVKSK